jgi:hypothetical protein
MNKSKVNFQISTLNNLQVTHETLVWVFWLFMNLLQFIMMDTHEHTVQVILWLYPSLIKLCVLMISVLTLITNYVLKISKFCWTTSSIFTTSIFFLKD